VHIADVTTEPAYVEGEPIFVAAVKLGQFRTILNVPMVKDDELIGTFAIYRQEVRPFTEKQIVLVQNFAAQAVIAIENARLLSELRQRTDELARSVEELRALGDVTQAVNSTIDLETVLTTIVAKATQLSNTEAGAIYVFDNASREFRLRATYGMDDTIIAEIRDRHIRVGETAVGRAVEQRMPIQVSDIQSEPSAVLDVIVRAGFRALLTVPLLGADQVVGALVVRRKEPGEFAKNTVELLQTFAAQSALAIQNARLFDNVETRTRELARSLNDLRTAQDRLVQTQKLASLGQLTAGIAHEIKNPLNFVNNFSGVSVELIDELEETLGRVTIDDKTRAEITELADMLRDNLDKIVQHGKRADSIVKNMLLHSRQVSGERRLVDVNALVEESLNLAYHGARAEKQGFNVTLQRSFDPSAGEVEAFPQEISRVLLNLISNGFYAATKRQGQESGNGFEPTITAVTKSLGDRVEIRIRDNGIGIQPEVREKMFNPFFTTKPAGEGTGLGLSISHDIIVKQHSGIIEVDTEPGAFTEFRIILPRTAT
jgi:signal transduction histidine kinase